jgi:hypothetical protein
MGNYKTDEDMWKLISPPCGVKGEGAFAALFAGEVAEGRRGRAGPVVVFDEIEEARHSAHHGYTYHGYTHHGWTYHEYNLLEKSILTILTMAVQARHDFMTSALVNAIDKRGFVELTRKPVDGPCVTEHASTAGAFVILTSNCFLHALQEEWAAVRRLPPHRGLTLPYPYAPCPQPQP